MSLGPVIAARMPDLKHDLQVAHIRKRPGEFVEGVIKKTIMFNVVLALGLFLLFDSQGWSLIGYLFTVLLAGVFGFWFGLQKPKIVARKRAADIDREVLFAGRFLLIKLHGGQPLVNALVEAANSYGVASKYFAEIVEDIELGTTLEAAIEKAMTYTPSDSFRKILFQIHTALKLGIDVTQSLESVLNDITEDQLLAIERYGKKLSSVTLFYMIVAVVFPSLGMTITTVFISFTSIQLDLLTFGIIVGLLAILNFMFITVFRAIRPKVNI